jgi:hypothetical protein
MIGVIASAEPALRVHGPHLILLGGWLLAVAGAILRGKWNARHSPAASVPGGAGELLARARGWFGLVALCTVAAAGVHVSVIGEHFEESGLFGTFFVILAASQIGFAVLVVWRPSATLLKAGALGSLAVVALWVMSRTVGIPVGPEAWSAEEVGMRDIVASVLEIVAALATIPALRALHSTRASRLARGLVPLGAHRYGAAVQS